jgi:Protein of unknown function (DUF3352)
MPETKSNSKFIIPALGAALLVVGGIAAYVYLNKGPSGDGSGVMASAKIIPDDAYAAAYITTDPEVWGKLRQFGTPEAQKQVEKLIETNLQSLVNSPGSNDISYEKDLKPWVGGVTIAWMPEGQKKANGNMLMVVGIKNKVNALNFSNKLKSLKGSETKEVDYKGQKIIEAGGDSPMKYSVVLGEYAVLAPEKQTIEQAVDTFKGEPSFASKKDVNSLLSKGLGVSNPIAQIYLPDYAKDIQQLIQNNPQGKQLSSETLKQAELIKSMVAGVGIDDKGLRVKAMAALNPEANKIESQNTPNKIVAQFPGETIALISGKGISQWWSTVVQQSKNNPEINQGIQQARSQIQNLNLDLDKDVFGWMDGEFGFAVIPADKGFAADFGFGPALLLQTSDRKTAENTFTKLDDIAKQKLPLPFNISQKDVGGKKVTEWLMPQQEALVTHGWLDDKTAFIALLSPVAEAILTPKGANLESSDKFKNITGSLQKPNLGYFYLDMDKTMSIVNRSTIGKNVVSPEANAILTSINGIGITGATPDKSNSQLEILLSLKPKK